MTKMLRSLLGLLVAIILLPAALGAAPIDVEADQVDKIGERVEARGGVVMTGQDLLVRAEYVVYDRQTQDVWATGQCYLKDKNSECTAATIYYNTLRGDLYMEDGKVTVLNQPTTISGRTIRRYGFDYYSGQKLSYTHCLGDNPAWRLEADSIEVPVEGFASAKNAKFKLGNCPVLYVPYFMYPAKLKRQSGVLFPEIGSSSDAGAYVGVPLYLVINESSDLTVTPRYLSKRGLMVGAEYRYCLDYASKGSVYLETLPKDRQGGETLTGGVNTTKDDQRWLLTATHAGPKLNYDINLVSTEEYFRDIGTFYKREEKNAQSTSTNGSEWNSDTTELFSRMQYGGSSHGIYAGVSAQWRQNLEEKGNHNTLQELPRLKLRMAQKSLPGTPLKISAEANTVHLVSRDNVEAYKNYITSEVSLPWSLAPYVSLRPYTQLTYRDTLFDDNDYGYKSYTQDGSHTYIDGKRYPRDSYSERWIKRGVSLTTSLYSPRFMDGYYHQMVPTLEWSSFSRLGGNYDPYDPSSVVYPSLLSDDPWSKQDLIGLTLNNYIRNKNGAALAEFSLSRNYDRQLERWANLYLTLKLHPSKYLSFEHTSQFNRTYRDTTLTALYGRDALGDATYNYLLSNPKQNAHTVRGSFANQEHSTTMNLHDDRGDQFWLSSDYRRSDDTKLFVMGAKAPLAMGFDARYEIKRDYKKQCYEYVKYGLHYSAQCWGIDLFCEIEPRDEYYYKTDLAAGSAAPRQVEARETTFSLRFNLLGFGDVLTTRFRAADGSSD